MREIRQIRNYYIAFRSSNVDIQNFLLISRFHFIKLSNVEIIRAIRWNHCIISKSTWANLRFLDFSLLDAREALDPTSVIINFMIRATWLNVPRQQPTKITRLLWFRPFSNAWRSASGRIEVSARWKRRSTSTTRSKVDACASLIIRDSPIHHHCPHAISNSNVGGRARITGYPLEFRNCASALVRAKTLDRKCNV